MLEQSELKTALGYDKSTGLFTRKNQKNKITNYINPCDGYVAIWVHGNVYRAHTLAWLYIYGVWPNQIDHINHNRSDNRIKNLRESTQNENSKNSSINKNNISGINGVNWHKARKKWRTYITVDYKYIHLGLFLDKFEAICARMSANNKYGYHENHGRSINESIFT